MKISIITVTYNSAHTIRDTIESVLNQTYKNIEYIIVDGKSNDETLEVVQEYESRFGGRMICLSDPDEGIYDAMNKGILRSTGEVIGILNSDDFFTSDKVIEKVVHKLSICQADAVYGDIHFVEPSNLKKCVRYYSSKIFKPELMRLGFMPAHPSCYIKRHCFASTGLYNTQYKIGADFEFLLRLIVLKKYKFVYMPIDFVTMRIGGLSTRGMNSLALIMKEHQKALKENGLYSNRFFLSLRYFYKVFELLSFFWDKKPFRETRYSVVK